MTRLSQDEFDARYREAVRDVVRFWTPEMQVEIARHNVAWAPGRFDFTAYLSASSVRYYRAYRALDPLPAGATVCDVGGFWGVFPLALKRLGYAVTMTEALCYYGESFNALFRFLADEGVRIVDYDPFTSDAGVPGEYDAVYIMAVLEHYPHSLQQFMRNVSCAVREEGVLYLEVPNLAFWPKRIGFLSGKTPLVPIGDVFRSRVPFTGHHHEFTMRELTDLVTLAGFRVHNAQSYNYSAAGRNLRRALRHPATTLATRFWPDAREILAVACSLPGNSRLANPSPPSA